MSAVLHSFLEGSVWGNDDQRRPVRQPVRFRIVSTGKIFGRRIDETFISDFGLFYDPEDSQLIEALNLSVPSNTIETWHRLIYWKDHSRGEIRIIDPTSDREIGRIVVMRRLGGDPSGETDWTNVISLVRRDKGEV